MKNRSFTLKSYPDGLALHIKPEAEMDELLKELTEKFQNSRKFFGNMHVRLAITGKELTREEEDSILDAIEENSDLQIACLVGNDEEMQNLFHTAPEETEPSSVEENLPDGQFYRGTLRKGQSLETEHSVIILGDVNSGAKVFSKKDVIILGALCGEVYAGMDEEERHFICALEFSPEKLKIGNYEYKKKPEKRFWPDSYKKSPKIATLSGDEIVVKPVTKESLGQMAVSEDDYIGQ